MKKRKGSAEFTLGKKEVKKPAKAKPGFVIYHTNFSMMAGTDISGLKQIE